MISRLKDFKGRKSAEERAKMKKRENQGGLEKSTKRNHNRKAKALVWT